jgi:hypothetical protein
MYINFFIQIPLQRFLFINFINFIIYFTFNTLFILISRGIRLCWFILQPINIYIQYWSVPSKLIWSKPWIRLEQRIHTQKLTYTRIIDSKSIIISAATSAHTFVSFIYFLSIKPEPIPLIPHTTNS